MASISFTQINDGTTGTASQVNNPLNTIYNEFNGNITSVNLADDAVTTAKLADYAATGIKQGVPFAASASLAAQTIPTGTETSVTFDTEDFDTDGIYSAGAATRLTVQRAGIYTVTFNTEWPANNTGVREVKFRKNGTTLWTQSEVSAGTVVHGRSISVLLSLASSDYVDFRVRQTSGGNLALKAQASVKYEGPAS